MNPRGGVYENDVRRALLWRIVLLVTGPMGVGTFLGATLLSGALAHGYSWPRERFVLLASVGFSAVMTTLAFVRSALHSPTTLRADGSSIYYSGVRSISGHVGRYDFQLPLSSVRSVGPTALKATEVRGIAVVLRQEGQYGPAMIDEWLLLSTRAAHLLGLQRTRGFSLWRRTDPDA
jgi:hypothetical protein